MPRRLPRDRAALDAVARKAARSLGSVASLVSVLDGERSFLRAEVGLPQAMVATTRQPLLDRLCLLVAGRSEPLVVADVQRHGEARVNRTLRRLGIRSCLGFSLADGSGHALGSFVLIGEGQRLWESEEIDFAGLLAAIAADQVATEAGALEGDEPGALLVLDAVEEAFEYAGGLEQALDRALGSICAAFGWDLAGAWVVDDDGERLSCRGQWHSGAPGLGSLAEVCRPLRFEGNEDMVGSCWTRREPIWSPELPPGERFPRAGVTGAAGLTCGAWIPLLAEGRSLGAIELLATEATPRQARTVPQLNRIACRIGELIAEWDDAPEAWRGRVNGPFRGLPAQDEWMFGADAPTVRHRA